MLIFTDLCLNALYSYVHDFSVTIKVLMLLHNVVLMHVIQCIVAIE